MQDIFISEDIIINACSITNNIDLTLLTETWLNDTPEDTAWLHQPDLIQSGYAISTHNRPSRGLRIALLYKDSMKLRSPMNTQIVNLSLTRGEFCEELKTAIVKPLLKKPGLDLINKNYRPISNLSFISKLVEICILKQLLGHCENHDLLPDFQSAYHKHYSTETSLIKLTSDILWSMEKQQMTANAILDLSSAFDTVGYEILLQILKQNFGFCGKALHWLQNYLRPWSFRVNINGKY